MAAVAVLLIGAAASLVAQDPPAAGEQRQPPPVTFRAAADFIEVDAFVTDADGRAVAGLTAADFELLEDGQRQDILSFTAVDIPITRNERPLFAARPFEPDVRTNADGEGRIYLIVLDDLHVHPSRVPRVRAALHEFIERRFGANDLGAVVRVRGGSQDSQDFTNNPRLLLRAIDRFTGNVPREQEVNTSTETRGGATARELEVARDASDAMARVRGLSEFLAGVRGRRKSLLFVSEGSAFDVYAAMGQLGAIALGVAEDMRKATAAAARGNVTIYPIDPRGLFPVDPNDLAGADPPAGSGVRLSQDYLRALADDTGGFATINSNDFTRAFERIVRENSAYYVLGYSPSDDRRDGRFRRIQVRVRRPGLQVRSRSGYTASTARQAEARPAPVAGTVSAAVADALASPLPTGGVPVQVFAAPYRGTGRDASIAIAIEMDVSRFDFVEKDGRFIEEIEVVHTASNGRGQTLAPLRHALALAFKPDTYERARSGGLRVLSQIELPPGRYQLRVAVGNRAGAAGGVLYDLDVPDFAGAELSMSGLSLTSSRAGEAVTVPAQRQLPVPADPPLVTTRTFAPGDRLDVFGDVYVNARRGAAHTVDITTALRTDAGAVVHTTTETRASSELGGPSGGYGFSAQLALAGLEPGLYVIHAEATLNTGSRPTVSRDIQIRIR